MSSLLAVQTPKTGTDFASSYAANADLGVILKYVASKHPELISKLPKLTQQYRKYMFLIGTGLFGSISVPSEGVDQIWHAHILHTALYAEFCENVAGRFIHHNPFGDEVGELERNSSALKLVSASETIFGTNVFGGKKAWCGSCAGCKACAGDCGGAVCGGAGEDISSVRPTKNTPTLVTNKPDCVCNNPASIALAQNLLVSEPNCQCAPGCGPNCADGTIKS